MNRVELSCPVCKSVLGKVNDDGGLHKIACRKCNKWIWTDLGTGEYEVRKIPERTTASGCRFY